MFVRLYRFFVFRAADRLRPWNFQFLGESCACAASHTVILSVLGAIIMASIIICALVLVLLVLAASAHTPLARITA